MRRIEVYEKMDYAHNFEEPGRILLIRSLASKSEIILGYSQYREQ